MNNPKHEKFVDLILRLTNAYWTRKTQMFSATYLVLADRNAIPSLADVDVETKALRLLEKTKASAIRVCNHCGWQWMQTYETDVELDEMFKRHTEQRPMHLYPDWTTHRNFNVKLVFDVGLEFKTKSTPATEIALKNIRRNVRNAEELYDWMRKQKN